MALDVNNPLAVAWDYWSDVLSGNKTGTAQAERIKAAAAADIQRAGGGRDVSADISQLYRDIDRQLAAAPIYPDVLPKLPSSPLFPVVLLAAAALLIFLLLRGR